ncbi:MAG TPA: amidohydrolase, partial [Geminicoccaceae bacterium]|nr:amidohydrolase [Geminicoccaceae bacterium]
MRIVDSHHHLWDRDLHPYPWLAKPVQSPAIGDTTPLCRNYLLADFLADARGLHLAKSVHLQAEIAPELAVEETRWLQAIADSPGARGFPHAIVAFADLAAPDVDRVLEAHGEFANMRGIRQILNRHSDPALNAASVDYLNDPAWQQGYARLAKHGYSFDLQLYWPQMADAAALAKRHPD